MGYSPNSTSTECDQKYLGRSILFEMREDVGSFRGRQAAMNTNEMDTIEIKHPGNDVECLLPEREYNTTNMVSYKSLKFPNEFMFGDVDYDSPLVIAVLILYVMQQC